MQEDEAVAAKVFKISHEKSSLPEQVDRQV